MSRVRHCSMLRPEPLGRPVRNRLPGEDTPTWLVAVFALIGGLVATAAAWLWLSAQSAVEPQSQDKLAERQVPAAPGGSPDANATLQPPAARGTAIEAAPAARDSAQSEPAPSTASSANDSSGHLPRGTHGLSVSVPPPSKLQDCQPLVAIAFQLGSTKPIITDARPALDGLVAFLKRHPDARVSVEGHADAVGPEDYNLLLSYRRAKAVVLLLSSSGVTEDRMVISAAGEFALLEGVPGDSGENRRVLLQVKGAESCQEDPAVRMR